MSDSAAVPFQMPPQELKERLDRGEDIFLLDVREPWELALAQIGGQCLPLGDLPQRLSELDPDRTIVAICHHGVRSARAVAFLRQNGFARAINLSGGIDLWSQVVDTKVPRY